jgi:hypothetical protein
MGFLDLLVVRDRRLAATTYAGRESASQKAARKRRESNPRSVARAAAQGQAWEDKDQRRWRFW